MRSAIVLGSTGLVGSHLVRALLDNADYAAVTAIARKQLDITHPKLRVLIADYDTILGLQSQIRGDELFLALGTTKRNSPNESDYYRIDHDYPLLTAQIARNNGVKSVFVVTAVGADAESRFFYVRTKGEIERDIVRLGFDHTHIFRPSMLIGERREHRPLEGTLIAVWRRLNPLLIGKADRYRGITGEDLARAIVSSAKQSSDKIRVYHWRDIVSLL